MSGLMHRLAFAFGAWATCAAAAAASPIRLDDSGSHTIPPHVQMQWRHAPGSSAIDANAAQMEASLRVAIQIDTKAHAGKIGSVYMVLQSDGGAALQLQWQTRGRLLPGRLSPGERALVFQGTLPGPLLADQLLLHVLADGQWASASRRLTVHFELELP